MSMVSRRQFLYSIGALGMLGCAGSLINLISHEETNRLHKQTVSMPRMGTFLTITAYNESHTLLEEALAEAFKTAESSEWIFTRHVADSPLGVLNEQGQLRGAHPDLVSLLDISIRLSRQTNYVFTPAAAPVLEALAAHNVESISDLPQTVQSDLRRIVDSRGITLDGGTVRLASKEMGISLDGIAKGHIVDLVAGNLESNGIRNYLVNAGGDIRIGPSVPAGQTWSIGVQDATSPAKNICTIHLQNGAMATSGNYESLASKGYKHLVSTSGDETTYSSVTVTAPTCTEADSLATALFAMGVEKGMLHIRDNPSYACLWQTQEGIVTSSNWAL